MKMILKAGLVMFTVVLCGTAFGQTQSTRPTREQRKEMKLQPEMAPKAEWTITAQPPATTKAVPHRRPEAVTMKQKTL